MTVKINTLMLENIKRIKAVVIEPTQNGLTIIGGRNRQGKTSVLDAIAWALGGARYKPDNPTRDGSVVPPTLRVELSNGLIVERKGANSNLTVTDPSGQKHGQMLLDSFIEELAINLPKFMDANDRDKAKILLRLLGIEQELEELDREEKALYDKRHAVGQMADRKQKAAEEMHFFPDAPSQEISASRLIQQQQEILARNGENDRLRREKNSLERQSTVVLAETKSLEERIDQLQRELVKKQDELADIGTKLEIATKTVEELKDESTEELEADIRKVDETNQKVRTNLRKQQAQAEADELKAEYEGLTENIEAVREARLRLLDGAELPLPELGVEDSVLVYQGQPWGNLAGSDQLKVATAITRKLNPECGFVLLDKLEQMDIETLNEFSEWAKAEGLQVIATRVSTGEECSLIIEDGYIQDQDLTPEEPQPHDWKAKL